MLPLAPALCWLFALCQSSSWPPQARLTLHVVWVDYYRLLPDGAEAVARELTSIFDQMEVQVIWEQRHRAPGSPPPKDAWLIMLRPFEPQGLGFPRSALGGMLRTASPGNTIYLFFPNVLRVLQVKVRRGRTETPGALNEVARALARVTAHELVHAVSPSLLHAPQGLMRARLDRAFLLHEKTKLDPATARLFQARLLALSAPDSPRPGQPKP